MSGVIQDKPRHRWAVVLCTDRNMLIPALFVAHAVKTFGSPCFDIVVVTDPEAATETETRWMADHGILHHVEDFADLRSVITLGGRLTTATLVKLILAGIFAGRYERILYLDTDLTVHGDVAGLFGLDLEGCPIGAEQRAVVWPTAEDRDRTERHFAALGMTKPYRYFNSGVLLIDVDAWNRDGLTIRTLDFVRANQGLCLLPDEDSLNAILNGRFAALSPLWNMAPRRRWQRRLHAFIEPVIIHYSGGDKPWRRFGRDKPLFPDSQAFALYRAFIDGSPWRGWLGHQWSWRDLLRSVSHETNRMKRRIAGRPVGLSKTDARRAIAEFRAHYESSRFIDVEQGLATRDGGRLRLSRTVRR